MWPASGVSSSCMPLGRFARAVFMAWALSMMLRRIMGAVHDAAQVGLACGVDVKEMGHKIGRAHV